MTVNNNKKKHTFVPVGDAIRLSSVGDLVEGAVGFWVGDSVDDVVEF